MARGWGNICVIVRPGLALAKASLLPQLEALAEQYSLEAVSLACLVWQRVKALRNHPHRVRRREFHRQLLGAFGALQKQLGVRVDAVQALLIQRHRASSAIEGFNATLRPFPCVHKGVTQGFLELFRGYYNLRTRPPTSYLTLASQGPCTIDL